MSPIMSPSRLLAFPANYLANAGSVTKDTVHSLGTAACAGVDLRTASWAKGQDNFTAQVLPFFKGFYSLFDIQGAGRDLPNHGERVAGVLA